MLQTLLALMFGFEHFLQESVDVCTPTRAELLSEEEEHAVEVELFFEEESDTVTAVLFDM